MLLKDLPVGTAIEFKSNIDAFGAYAEGGIRAVITENEQRDSETLYVGFSYVDFIAHNQTAETANYGSASDLKTATQAGVVPASEGLYFDIECDADEFVSVLDVALTPRKLKP